MRRRAASLYLVLGAMAAVMGVLQGSQMGLYAYCARPSGGQAKAMIGLGMVMALLFAVLGLVTAWSGLRQLRSGSLPTAQQRYGGGLLALLCLLWGAWALVDYGRFHSEVAPLSAWLWGGLGGVAAGLLLAGATVVLSRTQPSDGAADPL